MSKNRLDTMVSTIVSLDERFDTTDHWQSDGRFGIFPNGSLDDDMIHCQLKETGYSTTLTLFIADDEHEVCVDTDNLASNPVGEVLDCINTLREDVDLWAKWYNNTSQALGELVEGGLDIPTD